MEKNKKKQYDEFVMYKERLDEMYEENPEKATREAYNSLVRLGGIDGEMKKFSDDASFKLGLLIVSVIILLIGLLNISNYMLYIFGFMFFIAGMLVSLENSKFALIFVFSHGGTGLGLLIGSLMSSILRNPLLADGGNNLYVYLIVTFAIIIGGYLFLVVSKILDTDNINKKLLISLFIIACGLFLLALFPYIINYIYSFRI